MGCITQCTKKEASLLYRFPPYFAGSVPVADNITTAADISRDSGRRLRGYFSGIPAEEQNLRERQISFCILAKRFVHCRQVSHAFTGAYFILYGYHELPLAFSAREIIA